MKEFWLIGGMAAVTFAIRYTLLAASGRMEFPAPLARALKFVPPVVLTAIIVPAVLMPHGEIDLSPANAYLVAGLVAFGVGMWRKNLLLTIVLGMAAFLAWQWALAAL